MLSRGYIHFTLSWVSRIIFMPGLSQRGLDIGWVRAGNCCDEGGEDGLIGPQQEVVSRQFGGAPLFAELALAEYAPLDDILRGHKGHIEPPSKCSSGEWISALLNRCLAGHKLQVPDAVRMVL
jgi:hypothetical protein